MSFYTLLLMAGIGISFLTWRRLAARDGRLLFIYIGALVCAFAGAKIAFFFAEGAALWNHPDRWIAYLTGKSILGALLGGYLGVEAAKKISGYTAPTGDLFAIIAPLGILLGRTGCLLQGCCQGIPCARSWYAMTGPDGTPRWPAVPMEMLFNLSALIAILVLRHLRILTGQHFHIYLMAYGAFRFLLEFARETPALAFGWSGYQFLSLAVFALGAAGFVHRSMTARAGIGREATAR